MKRLLLFVIFFGLSVSICSANIFPSQALHQDEQFTLLLDNQDYQTAYNGASGLLHASICLKRSGSLNVGDL
jgi:hypothetical protein